MKHPIYSKNYINSGVLPDRGLTGKWAERFFEWLFCIGSKYAEYDYFERREKELEKELHLLLKLSGLEVSDANIVISFLNNKMVQLHVKLEEDLQAVLEYDPAAKSRAEVLVSYPGFFAISIYRIAHELWLQKVPLLPRLLTEYVHGKTGIDIHPGAVIGDSFFIDHGTGIVIGETAAIGNDVKMYQGVTLGALSVHKADAAVKRHPTIGNNVTIYANATILGGTTHIGDGSVIGGNVWLTHSVPSGSMVYHKSELIVKTRESFPEPLNFVI